MYVFFAKKFIDLELKTNEILLQFNLQYLITLDMSFNHFAIFFISFFFFFSSLFLILKYNPSYLQELLSRQNENDCQSTF